MKRVLIVSIILISVFFLQAQNEKENFKSLLYEVSGNGLENSSFVFGTIHIIPKADYFFTKKMKECLVSCENLVLEADIDIPFKEQLEMAKKMILPSGTKLETYMTSKQFNEFRSFYLDSMKIKESFFDKMCLFKPLFGQTILMTKFIKKPKSYEKKLMKIAKRKKIQLETLETLSFQIDILESISIEDQVEMMFESEFENPEIAYFEMLEVYKEQDINAMTDMFAEEPSMKKLESVMLTDRNKNWIPKIKNFIKDKPSFIAVGAAHLGGELGILNLLRAQGYTVTAVDTK